jgi:hypothetical protein
MRYLVLVYQDTEAWEARPGPEREALAQACRESDAALRRSGYLVAAERLEPADPATSIRCGAGSVAVEEGPLGPRGAGLQAVLTLQARDLNEAIQVVAAMPQALLGPIEVHALRT